jgi:hypothetical protein
VSERLDIDVGYRDPCDRPDDLPRERPSPSEYLDPPAPFECEFCGATERDHPEDRCERCPT